MAFSDESTGADLGRDELSSLVERNPLWYHTLDLPHGIVTPGWFDLRPVVDRLPWPDVRGKRCLDVATYDGFLAFEMERRGASEVVALDISDHTEWDWPAPLRAQGPARLAEIAGTKGGGFGVAHRALNSSVRKIVGNVYDLHRDAVGKFDLVVCGSLLLHLRDPMRALEAIRGVCGGLFMSCEEVDPWLTAFARRTPLTRLNGVTLMQWQVPNASAHERMLVASGFHITRRSGLYTERFGAAHAPLGKGLRSRARHALVKRLGGTHGVLHAAVLATPDLNL